MKFLNFFLLLSWARSNTGNGYPVPIRVEDIGVPWEIAFNPSYWEHSHMPLIGLSEEEVRHSEQSMCNARVVFYLHFIYILFSSSELGTVSASISFSFPSCHVCNMCLIGCMR